MLQQKSSVHSWGSGVICGQTFVFSTSFSAGSLAESSVPSGCYTASEGRAELSVSQAESYTALRPSGFSFMDQDVSSLPDFFLFWP